MTQGELEKLPVKLGQIFSDLEYRIMSDIVRRIKENGFSTASSDWQITRLQQLGESEARIKKWVQEALEASDKEIEEIFSDEVYQQYYSHKRAYQINGMEQIPFRDNRPLQQLISAAKRQIEGEYENMAASMGFAIRNSSGKIIPSPLMDFYRSTMDNAVMDIQSGAFSYQIVLERTINQMTASGVRWIDYDSGYHSRVDVAARRAVMTGFRQVQGYINEEVARDLGTDSYEVSWHAGARPSHQVWQGRVYTMEQLRGVCGLGTVTGLHGANCYHDYTAFIPGVSVRTYTDEWLDKQNRIENTPKTYNGKEYTTYEALQQQRRMETAMRKSREDIRLLEEGSADKESILLKKARYQGQMETYRDFSKKMDLPQQMSRVYQDGLRGRFTLTKAEQKLLQKDGKDDIIKENRFSKILEGLKDKGVEKRPVKRMTNPQTDKEIIGAIAGGDRTSGSCASAGIAYIGRKQGFDVLDFRGGESQEYFCSLRNLHELSKTEGIKALQAEGKTAVTVGKRLLDQCEEGKEYYLVVGRHAAIVRKQDGRFQYLELQSRWDNGWKNFDENVRSTLTRRFGCRSTSDGGVSQAYDFMIDIDGSEFSDDFAEVLGYINTAPEKQKKGVGGYEK